MIICLVIGGLAGYLAGQLMGRSNSILVNIFVGIVGGAIGNLLLSNLVETLFGNLPTVLGISISGLITAVLGSCILLWIIGFLQKK